MPMPEAAMDENHRVMLPQDNIWSAGEFSVVEPETKPARVQSATDHHFRPRVTALDRSHVPAAGFAVVDVSQPAGPSADRPALRPIEYAAS